MGVIIGIDVGGSTTKIVGFTETGKLIEPMAVKADDPITSLYGAFGKFTDFNRLSLSEIEEVTVTGVGSSFIDKPLYGLMCRRISEFDSIGMGGLYLSGLNEAIVVSMGTGTALVMAKQGMTPEYLGGTGVGGGTLVGLAREMLGISDVDNIVELASSGDLTHIDLRVRDIARKEIPGMSPDLTASNFGKLSDLAGKNDLALGLLNMIFETIAMLSLFASRDKKIPDIVLTGNMSTIPQAETIFAQLNRTFEANFIVPRYARFATVIGAALTALRSNHPACGNGTLSSC